VLLELARKSDVYKGVQVFVFSSELSVRMSVSDCQLFIYKTFLFCVLVEDKHTEPVLLCE
jgi:hypothetical protein